MSRPLPKVSASKYRGAGDVVAAIAHPVVKVIDATFGTDLQNCGGCINRKEWLNEAIPFQDAASPEQRKESQ